MTATQEAILIDITFLIDNGTKGFTLDTYEMCNGASGIAIIRNKDEIIFEMPAEMPAHIIGRTFLDYCEGLKGGREIHSFYHYNGRRRYGRCPRTFVERLMEE